LNSVRPPSQPCDARPFARRADRAPCAHEAQPHAPPRLRPARRDVDTIIGRIAEHAVISATVTVFGQTQVLRMNKTEYRQMLTATWGGASSYEYHRSNEKITIAGDQATITADIAESLVVDGQKLDTKARERATVESFDGTLMLTQLLANQVL
jgi:hypothetical protein